MNIPDAIQRQHGYRESLLRLGFHDDVIKLGFGIEVQNVSFKRPLPGHDIVTVSLYLTDDAPACGDFLITCGQAPYAWTRDFPRFAAAWNALTYDEREALYQRTQPWPIILQLAEAIEQKGIAVPEIAKYRDLAFARGMPILVPLPDHEEGQGN